MRRGGFFAGAVGGLAVALLLVGLVSVYPQANPPIPASSASTTCAFCELTIPQPITNSSGAKAQFNAPAVASSSSASEAAPVTAAATTSQTKQHTPDSLLTALQGESVGSVVATISPLLLGLLVAALVYSAYARRQDASS